MDNKHLKLAWFSGVAFLIFIISESVILIRMSDMSNQIGDKIYFASSNKTLNRVYRASPDIEITSDKEVQD